MHYANEICEEIANIFKSCSVEHIRQPVSDEDIDSKFEKLADILIVADGIYSKCHVPAGSLTYEDLHTISNTIEILSRICREAKLTFTVKARITEDHLMDYLHIFRGLKEYDEEFGD